MVGWWDGEMVGWWDGGMVCLLGSVQSIWQVLMYVVFFEDHQQTSQIEDATLLNLSSTAIQI